MIFDLLSETNKKPLRSIQYHALRHSMRKPIKSSHSELLEICKIDYHNIFPMRNSYLNEKNEK